MQEKDPGFRKTHCGAQQKPVPIVLCANSVGYRIDSEQLHGNTRMIVKIQSDAEWFHTDFHILE